MAFRNIVAETGTDGVSVVTINRPEKLNALNVDTIFEISQVLDTIADDNAVRGLILTGAGERAFAAGADIVELASVDPLGTSELSRRGQSVFRKLETMGKPSVAAIQGFALGGGLELAMACTLRVAAETAKLGMPEVKLGVIPGYGGSQRLPRLVGRGRALEMLLTGDPIDATEAWRIGLLNKVVPPAELMTAARALLGRIVVNAPRALHLTMKVLDAGLQCGLDDALQLETTAFGLIAASEDRTEGIRAFVEKRKPEFRGK
ncbi:MAG TPA: enoyl-CoA hydratase-related protein [Bryobacteraceae bacterium]|nr:enoyl-CoA hydratase-related protein [Bryobacteraceae bacterium]